MPCQFPEHHHGSGGVHWLPLAIIGGIWLSTSATVARVASDLLITLAWTLGAAVVLAVTAAVAVVHRRRRRRVRAGQLEAQWHAAVTIRPGRPPVQGRVTGRPAITATPRGNVSAHPRQDAKVHVVTSARRRDAAGGRQS
jgi:hypothetical protein